MLISFPYNRFSKITDGVMNTLNIMDDNAKKKIIEKKLYENDIHNFKIDYDHNYYRK